MHIALLILGLFYASSLGLQTSQNLTSSVSVSNVTLQALASTPVLFKLNPGVVNPVCSGVYASQIQVQYSTDDFTIDDQCRKFIDWMGGVKNRPKVDVIFLCSGAKPSGTGYDAKKLKLMVYTTAAFVGDGGSDGLQWLKCRLQGTDNSKGKVVSVDDAEIGFRVNDRNGFTFNQLTC
jgi:hypothetical protein